MIFFIVRCLLTMIHHYIIYSQWPKWCKILARICGTFIPGSWDIRLTACTVVNVPAKKDIWTTSYMHSIHTDCRGRLANAWGLGGLFRHHSKLVYALISNVCRKSV
jgi:hypothetical protein